MESTKQIRPHPQPTSMPQSSDLTTNTQPTAPHPPETSHRPYHPLPQQPPATRPTPRPLPRSKPLANRADWVNTLWADVSGQLRRFSVISPDLFDGLVLRRDTGTGVVILQELRRKYEELREERDLATVRVLVPETETAAGGLWRLLWTIKRPRDPNGRRFHSETMIDPIGHQARLEVDLNAGRTHSATDFLLPPFIQDYGPGPAEFDPEPESEFDVMLQGIVTNAYAGTWIDFSPEADGTVEENWV